MAKHYYVLLSALLLSFLISANMAWLNPRPGYVPGYRMSEKIPAFWQYNRDTKQLLLLAADFPDAFGEYRSWGQRPVYPALAAMAGGLGMAIIDLFHDWEFSESKSLAKAMLGYMIIKWIMFGLFAFFGYRLIRRFSDQDTAVLAVVVMLFSAYMLVAFTQVHMTEMELISPVLIMSMFLSLTTRYTLWKNLLFSILVGLLMLIKPNYPAYLALLVFSLANREFAKSAISFTAHLLPWMVWVGYMYYRGWGFRSSEMDHDMVIWVFQYVAAGNLLGLVQEFAKLTNLFFLSLAGFFSFWLVLGVLGIYSMYRRKLISNKLLLFILLFGAMTLLQVFASRYGAYRMTGDLAVVLFGAGTWWLLDTAGGIFGRRRVMWIVALVWLFYGGILFIMNLPLIHPYDQVPPYRLSLL